MKEHKLDWYEATYIEYNEDGVKHNLCTSPLCRDHGTIHTHDEGYMVIKNG